MARELTDQAKAASEEPSSSRPDPAQPEQIDGGPAAEARPRDVATGDIDPATVNTDEEDEGRLSDV